MAAHRLRTLYRRFLPRAWALESELRAIQRAYRPLFEKAKPDEESSLFGEYDGQRIPIEQELEVIRTQRLVRKACRYYIVPPKITGIRNNTVDPYWERGWDGSYYLRPAGVASVRREIEDAKKRRREVFESWSKIIAGLITVLVALGSVIVSLVLASRR